MASDTTSETNSGAATPLESTFRMSASEALETEQSRRLCNIIDELRRAGLSKFISLPQLIVVGDQSSGKSSVLENITGIPFPRNEGLCTRFATHIEMRRSEMTTIEVTISPDDDCTEDERRKLVTFKADLSDFSRLPKIIQDATHAMGLGRVGEARTRQLSKHVLSVKVSKSDLPNLNLVDLPRLIHVAGAAPLNDGREDDKTMIRNLVDKYMNSSRSIILAVVSGKNDYNNQIILDYWKDDSKSDRMLGIVTKPDTIAQRDIPNWIDLVQNKKELVLQQGWHMLRNRGPDEMDSTLEECNEAEEEFFSKGLFAQLPRDMVGVHSLRERLRKLLYEHIVNELPDVELEIRAMLKTTSKALEKLGAKRTTTDEQRDLLIGISEKIYDLSKGATQGSYEDDFFRDIDMDAAPDSEENLKRLRAAVQHLNYQFAHTMRRQGHRYTLGNGPGDADSDVAEDCQAQQEVEDMIGDVHHASLPKPKKKNRQEAIAWVQAVLVRTRGTELPGSSNARTVAHLFWEQSGPWKEIADEHISRVHELCKSFVYQVLQYTAPADIVDRVHDKSVNEILEQVLIASNAELDNIIKDQQKSPPMTYDKTFIVELQNQRQRKYAKVASEATRDAVMPSRFHPDGRLQKIDETLLRQSFANSVEQNMDKFSAEEALDSQRAYYKHELNYFIKAICKCVIERHLVGPLPSIILSQRSIHKMTDEQVESVAAESRESSKRRKDLEGRKAMLKKGLDTFKRAYPQTRR